MSLFSDHSLVVPPQAGRYQVIYVDAPWPERGGGKIKRGADRHYSLMKVDDIIALPVDEWAAPDAHLYSWVTNNYLVDGLDAMRVWGFRYVTKIDWFKSDIDDEQDVSLMDDDELQMGLGQYFRGVTESCLFGIRGSSPYQLTAEGKRRQGRTGFHEARDEHSAKPRKMRQMIELVSPPGPRLEMFARHPSPGWDAWGNESSGERLRS